jgi:hypothetical protein
MTVMIVLRAGFIVGRGFRIFALIACAAAFALVCILVSIGLGMPRPITTTLSC